MTADAIVEEARRWAGTPYRHGAALRGVGCDCLGLVRGVRAALGGLDIPVPVYPPDWAEASRRDDLLEGCERSLIPDAAVGPSPLAAGLVLLFRFRDGRPAAHLALAAGPSSMIHAHARAAVAEVELSRNWMRRLVRVFRYPEMEMM